MRAGIGIKPGMLMKTEVGTGTGMGTEMGAGMGIEMETK